MVIIKFCKAAVFFSYPADRMDTDSFRIALGGHKATIILFTDCMIIAVFDGDHHGVLARNAELYRNKAVCLF